MTCTICHNGQTRPGAALVTLARDDTILVVKGVPADVCDTCGEEYIAIDVNSRLQELAEAAAASGVQVDIRNYVAA